MSQKPGIVKNLPAKHESSIILTGIVGPDHRYEILSKGIKSPGDMRIWEKSQAYAEYLGFIFALNEVVEGVSISEGSKNVSPRVESILKVLDKLDHMIDDIPPIQQPQRFGNQAFRTWYQRLQEKAICFIKDALSEDIHRCVAEIMSYLIDCFGNSTRIDYGTGHEISFIMFLYCLFRVGHLTQDDKRATVCCIFARYMEIVRKLQQTYRMEPAGSHGVWSLDDYQFVPFIWGSSQLIGHSKIFPTSFLKPNVVEEYANEYLFLGCIKYINAVKTGPFAEHSNQLWCISGVPNWQKINTGLIRMYKAEVLAKFPVVQHILFGSLLPLKPAEDVLSEKTTKKVNPSRMD